jgi:hypothetical protein
MTVREVADPAVKNMLDRKGAKIRLNPERARFGNAWV